jgi:N-acetylglucosamine-6-phosphate deacetylase
MTITGDAGRPPTPPGSPLYIHGATLVGPSGLGEHPAVLVHEGRIQSIDAGEQLPCPVGARKLDATGLVLAPGFIDLQLNGAFGIDFTITPDRLWEAAAELPRHGVTAFLPTIISSPLATISAARQALLAGPPPGFVGARPLGLHLEGPFLAPARRGVHDETFLRVPDLQTVADWSPGTGIRVVTLAPELPGAITLVRTLAERGIVVSAGHSAATLAEGIAGIDAGIRYATHVFNAMPATNHREPGLIAAVLLDERVTAGFIADGIHVAPEVLALASRVVRPGRFSAVTDAIAALGMPPGVYPLGDLEVTSDGVTARLGDGRLAGSVLRLDQAIRNVRTFLGWSVADTVATVTSVPARLLNVADRHGVLAAGAVFDAVLLTPELEVVATLVAGRIVHARDALPSRFANLDADQR